MSKTKTPLPDSEPVGSGFIKISSGNSNTASGTAGPRTGETPAYYPSSTVNVGSGTSYVGNKLNQPSSRPGFLKLGGF